MAANNLARGEHGPVLDDWISTLGLGGKAVLTTGEVADVLRISERSVRELIKTDAIPSIRLGRRVLVPVPMLVRSLLLQPTED